MRKKFIYLEAQIKGYHKHIKDINKKLFYSFWELMETVGLNFEVSNEYIDIIDRLIDLGSVVVGDYYIKLDNQNADNLELLKEAKKQILKWKKFSKYKKGGEKMNAYEFTREEYEIYCQDHLLDVGSEDNFNRFREMVENGELVKCVSCEKWVDIDWTYDYENDSFVCEECKIDGFGL